jgi:hypothetical protein
MTPIILAQLVVLLNIVSWCRAAKSSIVMFNGDARQYFDQNPIYPL